MLSEPKIKKPSKAKAKTTRLATVSENIDSDAKAIDGEVITTNKEKLKKADKNIETGTYKADVKIVKNLKTGIISSDAYISDGTNKIWKYSKNNCIDKNKELLNVISKIINFNKEVKYIITVNNKKFVTDYNNMLGYYKEKEDTKETNILENIFASQNIGDIKIINNIRVFGDIIGDYKQFILLAK
jgi:hypothetical protein